MRVLDLPRTGKATALNTAVAASTGQILVFSDANTAYAPDAIRQLVRAFADPEVGGVAGNQVYLPSKAASGPVPTDPTAATAVGEGERTYWDFDRLVKDAESLGGSVISATGAIYAMRRELFVEVPDGVTDDFVTSTQVIAAGRRLVFEPAAVAIEPVAGSSGREYRRKVRIMTRGLRGVTVARGLLDPRRTGFYALQLVTHKVLRRLMAIPVLVIAATSVALWDEVRSTGWQSSASRGLRPGRGRAGARRPPGGPATMVLDPGVLRARQRRLAARPLEPALGPAHRPLAPARRAEARGAGAPPSLDASA